MYSAGQCRTCFHVSSGEFMEIIGIHMNHMKFHEFT